MKSLSCVRPSATPWTAAHQAPLSIGFSRQEHWSGLPFPSPVRESVKWSRSVVSDPQLPHGLQPTRLFRPWDFPGKSTGVDCHCLLQPQATATATAKLLQSCPTLCYPIDGSPPCTPVPGILQARTWSGLPFPSLMHESEKWKWNRSVVFNSQLPHGLQPTRLLRPWEFPGKNTGVGCHCLLPAVCIRQPKHPIFPCPLLSRVNHKFIL